MPKLLGRYQRTYAATLIRRAHDWLIVGMMDSAPNAWAQFVMTAARPDGPWSERRLVRHVERDDFHPPLLEFYPAFVHGGGLYAPSTSVARNRNFNTLFRVPLERATDPESWTIARCGSLWHSEAVESEAFGLWGQTFSGQVDAHGTLWALFPSRDRAGRGTIHVAQRPWDRPFRKGGFVVSGHEGPSFTCLRRAFPEFHLETRLTVQGVARLIWSYGGALGPDQPQSDAILHPLVASHLEGLELSRLEKRWRIVQVGSPGQERTLAAGSLPDRDNWEVRIDRRRDGRVELGLDDVSLWSGTPSNDGEGQGDNPTNSGAGILGWWVGPHSHLRVDRFRVGGRSEPARFVYLASEGLLGAGQALADWEERRGELFRYGVGFVARQAEARVKWNVAGRRFTLWSPRGPGFGKAEVRLDGRSVAMLDLHAERESVSAPVWSGEAQDRRAPGHAVVVRGVSGVLPVDVLVAEQP